MQLQAQAPNHDIGGLGEGDVVELQVTTTATTRGVDGGGGELVCGDLAPLC
eukprot:SAG11_NODE_3645_length_2315_cov_6.776625_2_plen_51_part_00